MLLRKEMVWLQMINAILFYKKIFLILVFSDFIDSVSEVSVINL